LSWTTLSNKSVLPPELSLLANLLARIVSVFSFTKGSVYATATMLVATDQLELLCRQSNIRSRHMTQYKEKGHFVKNTLSCLSCTG